jgi:DNA-binding transcriptional LysR family regulator
MMRIVKEYDDAVRALSKPELEGFIRFGSPEHYTIGILSKLLAQFALAYPDVLVEMRCENSDVIKDAVDNGEHDVGICNCSDHTQQCSAGFKNCWIRKWAACIAGLKYRTS